MFERSHVPLEKWLYAIYLLVTARKGVSSLQLSKEIGVTQKTAWFMLARFRKTCGDGNDALLSGIVEADETFLLKSFKGKKQGLPRVSGKRGGKAKKPGLCKEQVPVLICRDRGGHTADAVLEKVNSEAVAKVLQPMLARDSVLCAGSSLVCVRVARELGVTLKAVNVQAGIRVVEQVFHVQNVNAYDSRLKTWMRRSPGVATTYLPHYLGWRRLLDHFCEILDPRVLLRAAWGIIYLQHGTVI